MTEIFAFATEVFRIWGKFIDKKYIDLFDNLQTEYRAATNAPEAQYNQALVDNLTAEIKKTFHSLNNDLKRIEKQ